MESLKDRQLKFLANEVRLDEEARRRSVADKARSRAAAGATAASAADPNAPEVSAAEAAIAALEENPDTFQALVLKKKLYIGAVDLLKNHKKPMKSTEILARLDVAEDSEHAKTLLTSLRSNAAITLSGQGQFFQYRPAHAHVRNIDQLAALIRDAPSGVLSSELKGAYATVEADLQKLHKQRKILMIPQSEKRFHAHIIYPAPEDSDIRVSEPVVELWRQTTVKSTAVRAQLEEEMRKLNVPITRQEQAAPMKVSKSSKTKKVRQSKIHNVHIDQTHIDLTKDYTAADAVLQIRLQEEAERTKKRKIIDL